MNRLTQDEIVFVAVLILGGAAFLMDCLGFLLD